MRMRRKNGTRGYRGYHGRSGGAKKVLALVLTLVLLSAVAFLLAQRHVVYDSDGSYHFVLPKWVERLRTPRQAEPVPDEPAPAVAEEDVPEDELEIVIETPPKEQLREIHAVEINAEVLQNSAQPATEQLAAADANAVAVRLKNQKGELLYPSELPAAVEAETVAAGAIPRAVIEELTGSEYYTIARICTMHDSLFSFAHMADAAVQQIKYKNYIWYDPDSTFYLAPEKEMARDYLAGIAAECAAMGFNEILLDEFNYPPGGRQSNIKTSERTMSKEEALVLTAQEIRAAMPQDYTGKLSLTLDAKTVLDGGNENMGQSVALLAPLFDRFYVATGEEQLPELREALSAYEVELVPILPAAPAEGAYLVSP